MTDLKTVKRAYAAKLKVTRPDENPQGFMELRDAFEAAKWYIQFGGVDAEQAPQQEEDNNAFLHEDMRAETKATDLDLDTTDPAFSEENSKAVSVTPVKTEYLPFFHAIESILDVPSRRNNKQVWAKLIETARQSSIDDYIDFDATLRHCLLSRFGYYDGDVAKHNWNREPPYITSFVATYLFKNMEWHKANDRDIYIRQELDWLRRDMDVMEINRNLRQTKTAVNVINTTEGTGTRKWIIIGSLIAGLQILRLLMNTF